MQVALHCKGSTIKDTDMVKVLHDWKGQHLEPGLLPGSYNRFLQWVFCVIDKTS